MSISAPAIKEKSGKVRCQACAHQCLISPGQTGICGVRQNQAGELILLVYGRPVALHIDPIEKKPLAHFLPGTQILSLGTFGCNFRCSFCQNWEISQRKQELEKEVAGLSEWTPEKIVALAKAKNLPAIAYTYNEPTIFIEYAHDIMVLAQEAGLKNVFVTNGYATRRAWDYVRPYLDAANIDLKSFRDDFYIQFCGAHLAPVLDSITYLHQQGVWLEITTMLIPGQNDSDQELEAMANFLVSLNPGIPWHLSRFFPRYKMEEGKETPLATLQRAEAIGRRSGLKHIHLGNI